MATGQILALDSPCPLCGEAMLSIGRGGKVETHEIRPVRLFRVAGLSESYTICEECNMLTQLPADMTLN
jgi:hypothetical protein